LSFLMFTECVDSYFSSTFGNCSLSPHTYFHPILSLLPLSLQLNMCQTFSFTLLSLFLVHYSSLLQFFCLSIFHSGHFLLIYLPVY
jgi:hypothetical protein